MKKKIGFAATIGTVALAIITAAIPARLTRFGGADNYEGKPDCNTLASGMPSIREILTTEYASGSSHVTDTVYKTWGTVTAVYGQNDKCHVFIQNNYNDTGSGAICLYNVSSTIDNDASLCPLQVGDFVTVEGKLTYYNGMYEIDMAIEGNSYSLKESIESYDIEAETPTVAELTASKGSQAWTDAATKGVVRVHMNDLMVDEVTNRYAIVRTYESTDEFKIYYGGIGDSNNIYSDFNNAKILGWDVDVTGYLNTFDKSGSEEIQILVRYDEDVDLKQSTFVQTNYITLTLEENIISVGDIIQAYATVYPENATNKNIIYTSSDESVATIDSNGVIRGVGDGETEITVTSASNPSVSISKGLTVLDSGSFVNVTGLKLEGEGLQDMGDYYMIDTFVGDYNYISYSVLPSDATNKEVIIDNNNYNTVYTIDYGGELAWEAVDIGNAFISFTSKNNPGAYAYVLFNVEDGGSNTIESLEVDYDELELEVNEYATVTMSVSPSNFKTERFYIDYYDQEGSYVFEICDITGYEITIKALAEGTDGFFIYYENPDGSFFYQEVHP